MTSDNYRLEHLTENLTEEGITTIRDIKIRFTSFSGYRTQHRRSEWSFKGNW